MELLRPLRLIADLALPPRCPGCGAIVEADHRFCVTCWAGLDLLGGPGCALCNIPLEGPEGSICAPCLASPPRHDGVRAAVAYGDMARSVALKLKYGRRTGLATTAARTLARHVDGDGVLVPVPLHRWRQWGRGFNQAALIARALARLSGHPVDDGLLIRRRATTPLKGLSGKQRADALRGAFRTTRRIEGGRVWLVDDVYTSGATANACAAALKRAGATEVVVLAWARVIRQD
jgi:ComF family protein